MTKTLSTGTRDKLAYVATKLINQSTEFYLSNKVTALVASPEEADKAERLGTKMEILAMAGTATTKEDLTLIRYATMLYAEFKLKR